MSQSGHYVQANGLNIYYEEFGSGEPLILLHGALGTGALQWAEQIPILSPHFRVIVPDARGHGKTEIPQGEIRLLALGDDLAGLINALNLESAFLCGWSTGGDIALDVAIRYPDSVNALIVGGVLHRLPETYHDALGAIGLEGPGQVDTELVSKAISPPVPAAHAQNSDHWESLLKQISYELLDPKIPAEDDLKGITAPTLIIWGDRDQFLPVEYPVELYHLIPKAELAVIPNADHHVSITHAELFANLVKGFLLRH
jgi:pimeloyl-ACP methyl ester carboxylesterase